MNNIRYLFLPFFVDKEPRVFLGGVNSVGLFGIAQEKFPADCGNVVLTGHSQRRHRKVQLEREKICPGETRILPQLALQYLQVAGT